MSAVIIDTGPLVALFKGEERFHDWAVAQIRELVPPLVTCEAVVTEASFLLRGTAGVAAVFGMIARGALRISFALDPEIEPITRLMTRYASVPMSLADACLVRMAELNPKSRVMTIDSDFRVYRKNGRQAIPLIIPAP